MNICYTPKAYSIVIAITRKFEQTSKFAWFIGHFKEYYKEEAIQRADNSDNEWQVEAIVAIVYDKLYPVNFIALAVHDSDLDIAAIRRMMSAIRSANNKNRT